MTLGDSRTRRGEGSTACPQLPGPDSSLLTYPAWPRLTHGGFPTHFSVWIFVLLPPSSNTARTVFKSIAVLMVKGILYVFPWIWNLWALYMCVYVLQSLLFSLSLELLPCIPFLFYIWISHVIINSVHTKYSIAFIYIVQGVSALLSRFHLSAASHLAICYQKHISLILYSRYHIS